MNRAERLKRYLKEISRHDDGGVESIAAPSIEKLVAATTLSEDEVLTESVAPIDYDDALTATVEAAASALDKFRADADAESFSPEELAAIEAIIIPDKRPAIDIVGGKFAVTHELWLDLNAGPIAARLYEAIPSIGRIGLPGQRRIPYAGTGFVVGEGLLMTNRHVAEVFARGLGTGDLTFKPGARADIDFLCERGNSEREVLDVRGVRMIHPYWDMALLEVEGLAARTPLRLSLRDVAALDGRRVAVIGYPAFDPERNDIATQNQLFGNTFGVKRLQPGTLGRRIDTASFQKIVSAATHDCSTLGGNSGSAVIDLDTGEVLALHFGGRYLETNYCVPAFELANDGRVVDAGVAFAGSPRGGMPAWRGYWEEAPMRAQGPGDGDSPAVAPSASPPPTKDADGGIAVSVPVAGSEISITLPLTITLRLGGPARMSAAVEGVAASVENTAERLVEVWHDTQYADRDGYQADFIPGETVPPPQAADRSVVAPLLAGGETLHYRHFSVQMHAARRIALFTASNVTAEPKLKKPEPGFDYTRKGLTGLGDSDQEKWFPDPRLAPQFQLSDRFYTKDGGAFDKGHIVRRDDVTFGHSFAEVRQANGDTYHITNCSPQVAQFNQSARGKDNWGDLENLVLGQAASERYCLFAGPVLAADDQIFTGRDASGSLPLMVRIPKAFWKVVVVKVEGGVAAYAFVLDQDLSSVELEFTVPDAFRQRMTSIAELERKTGLLFPQIVRDADQFDDDRGIDAAFRAGIERVATIDEPEPDAPSPNGGDDEAAAKEAGVAPPSDDREAPASYRLAKSLERLRSAVNAKAPRRSKASDGWIGDAAHRSRASDHNPWVRDGVMGVVTAIDVTHDPAGGCDAGALAETLRSSADKRIKYIIWNRRIANRDPIGGAAAWAWRPYGGSNPHNHHVHISVRADKAYYDLVEPWLV